MTSPESKTSESLIATTSSSVENLLRRASAGDPAVLPELRSILRKPEVVEVLGNLARRVEDNLVDRLTCNDLTFREALMSKLDSLREELAGRDATPLERQLVERVVLCWLVVHEAEMRFANAGEMSIKQADYWQRRIDACHRRYLSAVKILATVRRLAIPVIVGQVNIARKQVNVVNVASMEEGPGDACGSRLVDDKVPVSIAN